MLARALVYGSLTFLLALVVVFSVYPPVPRASAQYVGSCGAGFFPTGGGGWCEKVITTIGSGTWTAPANWTTTNIIWAVGGGGGGAECNGGGGGGAFSESVNISSITPNQTLGVFVGAGGNGSSVGNCNGTGPGQAGGSTYLGGSCLGGLVCAQGGSGGIDFNAGNPAGGTALGGQASNGVHTFPGVGASGGSSILFSTNSGGGGGGAAGGNGSGQTNGCRDYSICNAGGADGGAGDGFTVQGGVWGPGNNDPYSMGGSGGSSGPTQSGQCGFKGGNYGGGGGGGCGTGGAGAPGDLVIEYLLPCAAGYYSSGNSCQQDQINTFYANKNPITSGDPNSDPTTLNWVTSGMSYCTISGPGFDNTFQYPPNDTNVWTPNLSSNTNYTLNCTETNPLGVLSSGPLTVTVNQPAFTYSLSVPNINISQSTTAGNTITATLSSGTAQPVTYQLSSPPSGVTVQTGPPICTPTCSSNFVYSATANATPGSYPITVTGTPPGNVQTQFNLNVIAAITTDTVSISSATNVCEPPSSGCVYSDTFTISRAGPTNRALTVRLLVGGTAQLNVDYSLKDATGNAVPVVGGIATVVIPAGPAPLTLTAAALAGATNNSSKTLTLTIQN